MSFAVSFLLSSVIMFLVYLDARRRGKVDGIDVGWSICIGLTTLIHALYLWSLFGSIRILVVAALTIFWSVRLSTHLIRDRLFSPVEDGRYRQLRVEWGAQAKRRFALLFAAQVPLALIFSLGPRAAMLSLYSFPQTSDLFGILLFVATLIGESISDRQLAAHRALASNKGKTCRSGLWRYSRHPNYFFEWLHWFSYLAIAAGSLAWYQALIPPAVLLFLFLKVTGIPPTEAQALLSRGDDYRDYQRTTSSFIPWPPRKH